VQLAIAWRLLPCYGVSALIRSVPRSLEEIRRWLELPQDWYQVARYFYARELVEANNLLGKLEASERVLSNVTIHARNDLVEETMIQRISDGAREVAIYYGAVHMPDLERRLRERGFRRVQLEWIDCWNVRRLQSVR
jgi:hypothetical protein